MFCSCISLSVSGLALLCCRLGCALVLAEAPLACSAGAAAAAVAMRFCSPSSEGS